MEAISFNLQYTFYHVVFCIHWRGKGVVLINCLKFSAQILTFSFQSVQVQTDDRHPRTAGMVRRVQSGSAMQLNPNSNRGRKAVDEQFESTAKLV